MHTTKLELTQKVDLLTALSQGTVFSIDYAYGGAKLVQDNEDGSCTDISTRQTKNELYLTLRTILRTLYFIQETK